MDIVVRPATFAGFWPAITRRHEPPSTATQATSLGHGRARPLAGALERSGWHWCWRPRFPATSLDQPLTTIDAALRAWIAEDLGTGDVTSEAVVPAEASCEARLLLKEPGVVCGLAAAAAVFHELDPEVEWEALREDGQRLDACELARLSGRARAILGGERLALNLLGRLSGVATLTRAYADAVEGTGAAILDTRKTTPGLRALEKEAVRCGGGRNHRFGLYDGILIKDNHLLFAAGVGDAVERAQATGVPVEVECDTLGQVRDALDAGADRILLDNMTPAELAQAVELAGGRVELEASGGVTLENVRAVAETGVDFVSIGALTHSARSLDVSLEVLK
jgi:nicotinate-nucleotide pyrophosphorylase (carboxylating)